MKSTAKYLSFKKVRKGQRRYAFVVICFGQKGCNFAEIGFRYLDRLPRIQIREPHSLFQHSSLLIKIKRLPCHQISVKSSQLRLAFCECSVVSVIKFKIFHPVARRTRKCDGRKNNVLIFPPIKCTAINIGGSTKILQHLLRRKALPLRLPLAVIRNVCNY